MMIGAPDMAFPRMNNISFWLLIPALSAAGGPRCLRWRRHGLDGLRAAVDYRAPEPAVDLAISRAAPGRCVVDPGRDQLHHHDLQHACAGHDPAQDAAVRVVGAGHGLSAAAVAAGACRCDHDAADRPQLRHAFFDPQDGGDPILYPASVLVLRSSRSVHPDPAGFGIVSHIISTFSQEPIFGYLGMAYAMVAIGVVGFIVWAHHMYTVGLASNTQSYFVAATMVIAVPTGDEDLLVDRHHVGRVDQFTTPMLWAIGVHLHVHGGRRHRRRVANAGMRSRVARHLLRGRSLPLRAVAGCVVRHVRGFYYWVAEDVGQDVQRTLAKLHFWLTFIGVNVTFFPMHFLGAAGHAAPYSGLPGRVCRWNMISSIGSYVSGCRHFGVPRGCCSTASRQKGRERTTGAKARRRWSGRCPRRRRSTPSRNCRASNKQSKTCDRP